MSLFFTVAYVKKNDNENKYHLQLQRILNHLPLLVLKTGYIAQLTDL